MILFIQLIWTHLFSFLRAASVNVPCSNIELLLLPSPGFLSRQHLLAPCFQYVDFTQL